MIQCIQKRERQGGQIITKMRKDKWYVEGEYGGSFTNLKDAKRCAREASKLQGQSEVWLIETGFWYIRYENGKCVVDGWTIKR